MGGLILGVNTLYALSCFLKQFALGDKGVICTSNTIASLKSFLANYTIVWAFLMTCTTMIADSEGRTDGIPVTVVTTCC